LFQILSASEAVLIFEKRAIAQPTNHRMEFIFAHPVRVIDLFFIPQGYSPIFSNFAA
jgi:hypothetical protein